MESKTLKIGIIGSGDVGRALALAFFAEGHPVVLGTRDPGKKTVDEWKHEHAGLKVGTFAEAAAFSDIIVLAVQGRVVEDAIRLAGLGNFDGKVVIDVTNPISQEPPVQGVLHFFTGPKESLMERIQNAIPQARVVKAFNSVGSALMYQPKFAAGRPTMFICGNDEEAKKTVARVLEAFGWKPADFGKVESARAIEALCMLWCIRGFNENRWDHAFSLLEP